MSTSAPAQASLGRSLLRGGFAVAGGAAACRLLQAVGYFALARTLAPSDFGAFAVAALFVNALALLPGMGLGTALLAQKEDPRRIARSALTVALGGGFVLALVALLLARLVAQSRGEAVGDVVALLGLTLLFQGAGAVANALLDRELRFRARALGDVAAGVAFVGVALLAAARGLGPQSLALGLVASAATSAACACGAARLLPAARPDFPALRATARVGAVVLATSLLQWLFVSMDVWIVEQRFGREWVGCYGVAFQLAMLPAATLGLFTSRLALPALVRARGGEGGASGAARAGFLRAARGVALLAAGATATLALAAAPIVALLYGEDFAAAAELLPPLALYSFARVLGGLAGPALLAAGRARVALLLVLAQDLVAIPVAWLLPPELGARGTALTFALATVAAGVVALRVGARALRVPAASPAVPLAVQPQRPAQGRAT